MDSFSAAPAGSRVEPRQPAAGSVGLRRLQLRHGRSSACPSGRSGTRAAPAGLLRIDLPVFCGKRFVMPLLAGVMRRHPALQMDIRLTDLQVDIVRDGVDLAVRIGPLRDSTLVARRGTPRRLEDLSAHDAVIFRLPSTGRDRPWQFRQRGADVELPPAARVRPAGCCRRA